MRAPRAPSSGAAPLSPSLRPYGLGPHRHPPRALGARLERVACRVPLLPYRPSLASRPGDVALPVVSLTPLPLVLESAQFASAHSASRPGRRRCPSCPSRLPRRSPCQSRALSRDRRGRHWPRGLRPSRSHWPRGLRPPRPSRSPLASRLRPRAIHRSLRFLSVPRLASLAPHCSFRAAVPPATLRAPSLMSASVAARPRWARSRVLYSASAPRCWCARCAAPVLAHAGGRPRARGAGCRKRASDALTVPPRRAPWRARGRRPRRALPPS